MQYDSISVKRKCSVVALPAVTIFASVSTATQAGPMVHMMPLIRWTCGGESMSSSHIDSRCVAAYAAASWCSYDPSVVNVATLAQLFIGAIAANEPEERASICAIVPTD